MPVALYTFGLARSDTHTDAMRSFVESVPGVYDQADRSEGFIGHAMAARPDLKGRRRTGDDYGAWGLYTSPHLAEAAGGRLSRVILTLSLWRDAASARDFSYGDAHCAALDRRREWFEAGAWPGHVLWSPPPGQHPTWAEGALRLDLLAERGPAEPHFTFAWAARRASAVHADRDAAASTC